MVLEEPPVGYVYLDGARIEEGVVVPVEHDGVAEQHFVEKREIDTLYPDGRMKVLGEAGGDFGNEPGLDRGQLNKHPSRD